jgi:hypothetical protein
VFDHSVGAAPVRFTAGEMAFAARIFEAFGTDRFTVQNFYRHVSRTSRCATSPEDVAAIYETIEAHGAALLPAPGMRGDDGWRLDPLALAAMHRARLRRRRARLAHND